MSVELQQLSQINNVEKSASVWYLWQKRFSLPQPSLTAAGQTSQKQ